ncbi:MAG: trypsin-like peptidase domain-containing protein [Planctomycetota bacterium]
MNRTAVRRTVPARRRIALLTALTLAGLFTPMAAGQIGRGDFRQTVREARTEVFPAVVYIRVLQESTEGGRQVSVASSGSGVIISPDGEVLTNWHVIDRARSIRCLLSDGTAVDGRLVGQDQDTDLALLQLENLPDGTTLPHAEVGSSAELVEGDFVMAMGAPFGLNRSVSIGIISCVRRFLPEVSTYSLWLQTDAAINPGNSGGPLVDTEGRVIGLNTRGMGAAQDMGFAIPADTISALLPQLREHGRVEWSWTGLQLQPLHDFDRNMYFDATEGVIVAGTFPGSPARRAGLEERDRIVSVNGIGLTALTSEDLPDVRRRLGLLERETPARFEVVRTNDDAETRLVVELTPREKGDVEGDELVCDRWDFTAKTINQFDNPSLHFHQKEGVFIYGLKRPGNAMMSGLRENDILIDMDREVVRTLDDVRRLHAAALEALPDKHTVAVTVLRGGLRRLIVLKYARDYEKD